MNTKNRLLFLLICSVIAMGIMFAQVAGDYRAKASGNWSELSIWETYSGSQWEAATTVPDFNVGEVSIDSGYTVTVASDLSIDSVAVHAGGHIVINPSVIVTVPFNSGMYGIDVDTLGTVTVNGKILCEGSVSGAVESIIFNDGAVYEHARNRGSIPKALWNTGSTLLLTGIRDTNASNTNQNFYNIVINCDSLIKNLNLGMSGNTIGGNVTVIKTGTSSRYYLSAPNAYTDPITIMGDIVVEGGQFSSNGSSSAASFVIYTYGNVHVTGGNFAISRGSAPNVSWYLYGDFNVSNATLQASTSGPSALQKFIFAKQGTQKITLSNVTYGGATSPISIDVDSGTTVDLDTSVITSGNTGSFWLNDGATLITNHTAQGQGRIECTGDVGSENNFVDINAISGTGMVSVQTVSEFHPGVADTGKALHRYWKINADPGITEAEMSFYYKDFIPPSEVRGTELSYLAGRFRQLTGDWEVNTNMIIDDLFDVAVASGVTTVSGEWTLGEASSLVTTVENKENIIPQKFSLGQNYPNPFNPSTTISYGLPKDEFVTIKIYNVVGQEVTTMFEGRQTAGLHKAQFNARNLTSGIYFYRINAGGFVDVKRMVLLK